MATHPKSQENIFLIIKDSIHAVVKTPVEFKMESALKKDLNIQSIDLLEIIFTIEKKLETTIDLFDFFQQISITNQGTHGTWNSIVIKDLVEYIHKKLSLQQNSM